MVDRMEATGEGRQQIRPWQQTDRQAGRQAERLDQRVFSQVRNTTPLHNVDYLIAQMGLGF